MPVLDASDACDYRDAMPKNGTGRRRAFTLRLAGPVAKKLHAHALQLSRERGRYVSYNEAITTMIQGLGKPVQRRAHASAR